MVRCRGPSTFKSHRRTARGACLRLFKALSYGCVPMPVLVINCGSTSIKAAVVEPETGRRLAELKVERIGSPEATATFNDKAPTPCPSSCEEALPAKRESPASVIAWGTADCSSGRQLCWTTRSLPRWRKTRTSRRCTTQPMFLEFVLPGNCFTMYHTLQCLTRRFTPRSPDEPAPIRYRRTLPTDTQFGVTVSTARVTSSWPGEPRNFCNRT